MKVTTFGVRGATPISNSQSVRYGGNTTCVRIESECIPDGCALVVDTGTGFVPCSRQLLAEGVMKVGILYTHWHHDHTQGLLLAPHTFSPQAEVKIWGPKEHGMGPLEVFRDLMTPPFFPEHFALVQHRIKTVPLSHIGSQVLVIHPKGGAHLLDIYQYRKKLADEKQLTLGDARYSVSECLVVFMHKTVHPEYTISYRFEEKPTGRVFVFLTDHENTASLPRDLFSHVQGAHLLVQDGQYSSEAYRTHAAGFGHGTPEYCVEVMLEAGAERLGITHHDPSATDADIDARVREALSKRAGRHIGHYSLIEKTIFACADYQTINV